MLGLVEFEKCAIFLFFLLRGDLPLGLVEFEKCAIFYSPEKKLTDKLGLVEFEKCAIFSLFGSYPIRGWGL